MQITWLLGARVFQECLSLQWRRVPDRQRKKQIVVDISLWTPSNSKHSSIIILHYHPIYSLEFNVITIKLCCCYCCIKFPCFLDTNFFPSPRSFCMFTVYSKLVNIQSSVSTDHSVRTHPSTHAASQPTHKLTDTHPAARCWYRSTMSSNPSVSQLDLTKFNYHKHALMNDGVDYIGQFVCNSIHFSLKYNYGFSAQRGSKWFLSYILFHGSTEL